MKLSDKHSRIILAAIIIVSLVISTMYMMAKQGYHEDEFLTYNLANSQKQLAVDGDWNTPDDFTEYLAATDSHRFDYGTVIENQVRDGVAPPLYYALLHTVCSFFPNVFSPWFAFALNALFMAGTLLFLYKVGKRITDNNIYALIAVFAYAFSIACITTTIYIRMYAALTFFTVLFMCQMIKAYERKNDLKITDCLLMLPAIIGGMLTQYYFIMFAGLIGIVFVVLAIKEKFFKGMFMVLGTALVGAGIAMLIYPHIIENIFGGSRGVSSLNISVEFVTILTYVMYKLFTYVEVLSKDLFLGQIWLFALCTAGVLGSFIYLRFIKKRKLNPKALFVVIPTLVFFVGISLLSPFNSDRYIMPAMPFIAMVYVFAFIRLFESFNNAKIRLAVPAAVVLACALSFVVVKPYYIYGRTNLYDKQTDKVVFVGTAMLEYNKVIDKLMMYDEALIVRTPDMDPDLGSELEKFAEDRGVVTNGMITDLADSYMSNGMGGDAEIESSLSSLATDKKLAELKDVTVYISRLADGEKVIDYITKNTKFKNYELIQADYDFDEFYNWYDYFVETESYCNVYRFY